MKVSELMPKYSEEEIRNKIIDPKLMALLMARLSRGGVTTRSLLPGGKKSK